jgi:hypothetical protein
VIKLEPKFLTSFVNLQLAEVACKLHYIEISLDALKAAEKGEYTFQIPYLRGKCYEQKRHYNWAVDEYSLALSLCDSENRNKIMFLLGHAKALSKLKVEEGIAEMLQVVIEIPNSAKLKLKLANAIYTLHPIAQTPN